MKGGKAGRRFGGCVLGLLALLLATAASLDAQATAARMPGTMTIGRLHYDGGGDWYANPSSLPNLLAAIASRTSLRVAIAARRFGRLEGLAYQSPPPS